MKDLIITLMGYFLSLFLILTAILNFRKDKKRHQKIKEIIADSTQKIAEELKIDKAKIKEKLVVTHSQFHRVQNILNDTVFKSENLKPSDKTFFYNSMYQPSFQGQYDYLNNLFTTSGATQSFIIKEENGDNNKK